MPWSDKTFDAVILADVLHHDHNPERLLRESVRVSRRLVIVKDHLRGGLLAQQRISLLDWAANAGYNVPVLYRYNNLTEWRGLVGKVSTRVVEERTSIDIYPPVFNRLLRKRAALLRSLRTGLIISPLHAARTTNWTTPVDKG